MCVYMCFRAKEWIDNVRYERGDEVLLLLVGNKTDIQESRQVTFEEGDAKAREWGVMFIETSAKINFNIKALFHKMALALPSSSPEQEIDNGVQVIANSP